MSLYDNYINLLLTKNFIGGGGQDLLPEILQPHFASK